MRRRGFTIVEAVIATLIVGIMLVAALSTVAASRTSRARIADRMRAEQLALDLMAEILQQPYQDPIQTPVFGLEPGESATSRAAWNDIDDYNGWTESPPQTKSGNLVPDGTGWTRSVLVEWINSSSLTSSNSITGVKRVTVTVQRNGMTMAQLAAIRSLGWADVIPTPTDATSNHPPTAAAAGSPLTGNGTGHLTVNFDGSGSSDPDGDPLSFVWAFGDGSSAGGISPSHTYNTVGTFNATLTVTDGHGGVGIGTVTVTVN